jgi:hypothetical protein
VADIKYVMIMIKLTEKHGNRKKIATGKNWPKDNYLQGSSSSFRAQASYSVP